MPAGLAGGGRLGELLTERAGHGPAGPRLSAEQQGPEGWHGPWGTASEPPRPGTAPAGSAPGWARRCAEKEPLRGARAGTGRGWAQPCLGSSTAKEPLPSTFGTAPGQQRSSPAAGVRQGSRVRSPSPASARTDGGSG